MEKNAGFMKALKCRECGREYPLDATHVCEFDFGPLEVVYDYDRIKQSLNHSDIQSRPPTMWRYRELLPVAGDPTVGFEVGFTPLIRADRLARQLGVRELWVKNDTVNYPTLSFKDRVVSVALSRARELGFTTVACASTGNLANSVAANAAAAGLKAYVFIPADLEQGKVVNSLVYGAEVIGIKGHYDEVNRLCAQATGCARISTAQKAGLDCFKPVKPNTIAKSLAIGTPADGFYALKVMKETGGAADDVTDDEVREGIRLLAECEGIFAETAGGVTVGVAKKLIVSGRIPANDSVVLCVTGNGLKTLDAVVGQVGRTREIKPSLRELEALLAHEDRVTA